MIDAVDEYEKYCAYSKLNNSQPVWFDDAFLSINQPSIGDLHRSSDKFVCFSSARASIEKSIFSGGGKLTLILCFGSRVNRLNVNVIKGDLTLFVGPHAKIDNLTVQSFDDNNRIHFGAGCTVNTGNLLVQGVDKSIFFGHDCMFLTNFHARTSDSHSIFSYCTGERINCDRSIKIGDHTWIGRSCIINKGVEGDDDVVLGQGAIVNGVLIGAAIYAGVPARMIKNNVSWDRDRVGCLNDIKHTIGYRPIQSSVNRFLLDDLPFHPNASGQLADVRELYKVSKGYRWLSYFSG